MTISWESHHEINGIMVRVHQCINQAKWDDLAVLFARASVITRYAWSDTPIVATGNGERVADAYRTTVLLHDGLPRVQYTLTNVLIDGDDDAGTATSWSQYLVIQGNDATWSGARGVEREEGDNAARISIVAGGRYEDEFQWDRGQWWLTKRTCHADFTGDRSQHMGIDPYDAPTIDKM